MMSTLAATNLLETALGAISWARTRGAHLHFLGSGAVHGSRTQSQGAARGDRIAAGTPAPLDRAQAYGNAKRMAESLVACAGTGYWPDTALARSLGLTASIDRPAAIADMLAWARGRA